MNKQFSALSGVAILLIVLNHTIEMDLNAPLGYGTPHVDGWTWIILSLMQTLGFFAVPIFLFISGAFVAYAARGNRAQLANKFMIRSLGHICWPYVFWSAAFYALIFLQFGKKFPLQGYTKNLLVGYPFHFIPLLIFFYLLSPLLVRLSRRYGLLLIAGIAVYQVCLLVLSLTDGCQAWLKIFAPPVIRNNLTQWAVFFPLGLVYGMHIDSILPSLRRTRWLLLFATVVFFVLSSLSWRFSPYLSLCRFLSTFAAVLLLPVIERQSIPQANLLESIGKRSYGIYLSHLIVLDLTLLSLATIRPWLMDYRILFLPILYFIAIRLPLLLMSGLARSPGRPAYRYIFG
jgi:surface polysaccharide O-acyltransferase-like enzyme